MQNFFSDRWKIGFLLLTFCVSFGYALLYRIPPSVDARLFHETAMQIATHSRYCVSCDTVPPDRDPAMDNVGPGYQFFLSAIYRTFGVHLWIVWLIQALMHTIVVAWLWTLLKKILPSDGHRWHFFLPLSLYAFHPDLVQQTAMLMSEALFVFLMMASVRLLVYLIEKKDVAKSIHWITVIGLGLILGALFMVRPPGLLILLLSVAFLIWRRLSKQAVLIILIAVALQVPWNVRNVQVYHHFVLNAPVGGRDFWVGLHPESGGEFNVPAEVTKKLEGLDAAARERVSLEETKKSVLNHPGYALKRTVHKAFKLFALSKTSGFWFHYRSTLDHALTVVGSILFNFVLWSMAFAQLWEIVRTRRVRHWLVLFSCLGIIALAIAPTLTVVINRYRIPMLPFATLLAVEWLMFVRGKDRWKSLLGAWAILIIATISDVWGNKEKVLEHLQRIGR
ncbi:MAG: hypothetical protein Q8R07_03970 [Candidatus Uhrbacteria bacterium]|nr:hypothetical protein [Candidatus Uhrbacteria bacterium]